MLREKIKNWKMELAAVLVFVLVLGMTGLSGSVKAADQTDLKTIDIMFVHDTHSHLNSVPMEKSPASTTSVSGSFSFCSSISVLILANPPIISCFSSTTVEKLFR